MIALPDSSGPRVVRTPDNPWGMDSLRLSELQQVSLGNLLLGFSLVCLTAMATVGGSGVLEHPRDCEDPSAASIWRLPIVRLLLNLPDLRLVHLAQGLFGAPTSKPTILMVLGLKTLEADLHAGLVPHLKEPPLETAQVRTSPLKEYPPGM